MQNNQRNSLGLFDASLRSAEKEGVLCSREDIARQLDAGAFLLSWEEAGAAGFLNPQDMQDCVIIDFREADQ